jgi:hypothetical protein
MRIIIAGSRILTDYSIVCRAVESSRFDISMVISGGARGVDTLGEQWARQHKIAFERFSANWGRYGKSAGMKRNREMAIYADGLLAIWNGRSRGTKDMIDVMFELKKPIFVYSLHF